MSLSEHPPSAGPGATEAEARCANCSHEAHRGRGCYSDSYYDKACRCKDYQPACATGGGSGGVRAASPKTAGAASEPSLTPKTDEFRRELYPLREWPDEYVFGRELQLTLGDLRQVIKEVDTLRAAGGGPSASPPEPTDPNPLTQGGDATCASEKTVTEEPTSKPFLNGSDSGEGQSSPPAADRAASPPAGDAEPSEPLRDLLERWSATVDGVPGPPMRAFDAAHAGPVWSDSFAALCREMGTDPSSLARTASGEDMRNWNGVRAVLGLALSLAARAPASGEPTDGT